jgi:type I restriction-modification system DNA methylase subunit
MANSASDARSSEQELRRQLIDDQTVDMVVAVGLNMFYTVTLPVTLWFLDRGKKRTLRGDKILFVDARQRHLLALEQAGHKPEPLVHDVTLLPRHVTEPCR